MAVFTLGEASAQALGGLLPERGRKRGGTWSGACAGTDARDHGVPVRRDSLEAGSFEQSFFIPPARGETDRLLRTARAALDAGRRLKRAARAEARALSVAERALAGLTAGAIRVFEELCTLARLNRGRVFPSYDHLARTTALGRATVARALAALERAGFVVRQRRFRRIGPDGAGPGPRYAQTSNVYRPILPARLLGLLPRWLVAAPIPGDAMQHVEERAREHAAMHAGLCCRDLGHAVAGGALGRVLARLGAALDARESHDDPETPNHILIKRHMMPS